MAEKGAPAVAGQIALGERTTAAVKEAEAAMEQAQVMFKQADARITGIVVAWREAQGLPDTWKIAKAPDGRYFMADQAMAVAPQPAPQPVEAPPAPDEPAA